jgi:urea carboxylase
VQRLHLHAAADDRDARVTEFDTLLVANRGEIARRLVRGARERGIRTVAVFSDADRAAPHVREADIAVRLGPAPADQSYLRVDALIDAAHAHGAGAVHPGYGFLAENAAAARAFEAAGIRWVGPTPDQLESFGAKHTARALAAASGVPLLPGTGLLDSLEDARAAAEGIGFPVILKATGGGGGIGMQVCDDAGRLREAWDSVLRLAATNFASAGVYLEKLVRPARDLEVQVFGDGHGRIAVLGDRDCTLQRRNQKVLEEAPAPGLPARVRRILHDSARRLGAAVGYRSAGTVEFVYDPVTCEPYFLEVNTRLQVEHPVTEAVTGLDLVHLMLDLAREGLPEALFGTHAPSGHAVEARIYAEDPGRGNLPSTGLVTRAELPAGGGVRVDGWVEAGTDIGAWYDPLLAKVIAHGATRDDAFDRLHAALAETRIDGIATTTGMLRAASVDGRVRSISHDTSTLASVGDPDPRIDVVAPGLLTTVQDLPGRLGYWHVGAPPSGPMDAASFREANLAVGNAAEAPALEAMLTGPTLVFGSPSVVCVTGAATRVTLDGTPVAQWEPIAIAAGSTLAVGAAETVGLRMYVAVRGGIDVPTYLGSASTFDLGGFGGHGGRALVTGDVLRPGTAVGAAPPGEPSIVPTGRRPHLTNDWEIGVTEGPHGAPEFFTRGDLVALFAATYEVQVNSARTGVRLSGPRPEWARDDGGEAGLHPSNIHDTPYAVGALDFTGDTPIILGPDGPSLGGFVCPVVVASGELWKTGQLRPGDRVRFVPVREADAAALYDRRGFAGPPRRGGDGDDGRLAGLDSVDDVYRTVFDAHYLVLGLGDVYLGAPVATPLDPRHRLVTTKYNPARTWTAENSVGIGGAYLCIYGMEGPGGYQFVGRTVQVWNTFRRGGLFDERPWALRFFDRIRWYPVAAEELLDLRADTAAGRAGFETVDGSFALAAHRAFLDANSADISLFRDRQRRAFGEERERWRLSGELDRVDAAPGGGGTSVSVDEGELPPGTVAVTAPFGAVVWRVEVAVGDRVEREDRMLVLEAMKMEAPVSAPEAGTVAKLFVRPGQNVAAGQILAAVEVSR